MCTVVLAHTDCGAGFAVCAPLVIGCAPAMFNRRNIRKRRCPCFRPVFIECSGIGGFTFFGTSRSLCLCIFYGCSSSFTVCTVDLAHMGCGTGFAVRAPLVVGCAPIVTVIYGNGVGQRIFRFVFNNNGLCAGLRIYDKLTVRNRGGNAVYRCGYDVCIGNLDRNSGAVGLAVLNAAYGRRCFVDNQAVGAYIAYISSDVRKLRIDNIFALIFKAEFLICRPAVL